MTINTIFLLNGTTSWIVPADFNSNNNSIGCTAAGASGAAAGATNNVNSGGGGAYSGINNIALTAGASIQVSIGLGGASVNTTGSGVQGIDGGNTWFNGTSLAAASCSAEGGKKGNFGTPPAQANGGLAANGIGTIKFSGGSSPSASIAGGGAAAGPGGNGGDGTTTSTGRGGNTAAVALGGNNIFGGTPGGNGANGIDYDATHGAGAGGGLSNTNSTTTAVGGDGGNYGGGGGGGNSSGFGIGQSGKGGNGLIRVQYTVSYAQSDFFLMYRNF